MFNAIQYDPANPSASNSNNNSQWWSIDEQLLLIETYEKHYDEMETAPSAALTGQAFQRLVANFNQATYERPRTPAQIEYKWNDLQQRYKEEVTRRETTGAAGNVNTAIFEKLNAMGRKYPTIIPPLRILLSLDVPSTIRLSLLPLPLPLPPPHPLLLHCVLFNITNRLLQELEPHPPHPPL